MATAAKDIVFLHQPDTEPLPLPVLTQFTGEGGRMKDFVADETLMEIADDLIRNCPELGFLVGKINRIGVFYKREGGKERNAPKLGGVQITKGLLRDVSELDLYVWVAWDHAQAHEMTPGLARRILYHNLMHLGLNDKGKLVMREHDFEGFFAEVKRFGPWHGDLSRAKQMFDQTELPFGEPAGIVP